MLMCFHLPFKIFRIIQKYDGLIKKWNTDAFYDIDETKIIPFYFSVFCT
jgi:hypothetical protein